MQQYQLKGFKDFNKRIKVINSCLKLDIDARTDGAFLYNNTFFLKRSFGKPNKYVAIERLIDSDWDGVWNSVETPSSMKHYLVKAAELNPGIRREMPHIKEIMANVQTTLYPDDYLNDYERIFKKEDFKKSQHDACVEYAVSSTKLTPGATECQIGFEEMNCELRINSGSLKDIIVGTIEKNFLIKVPENRIKASVKHFRPDGTFYRLEWNLGYKKQTAQSPNQFGVVVSDNRESDFMMAPVSNVNYKILMTPAIWTEGEEVDTEYVETWQTKARYDMRFLLDVIRKWDLSFLMTLKMNEDEFNYLVERGFEIKNIYNSLMKTEGKELYKAAKKLAVLSLDFVEKHQPFFPIQSSEILAKINRLWNSEYETKIKENAKEVVEPFKKHSLPFNLPRNFL